MKNRLSFAIVVLVAAMLACKVPLIDDQPEGASFTEILSMAVKPPAGPGSGSFKLEVTYRAYREDPPEIYCFYVRPDGATIPINTIVPLGPRGTLFTIRPYSTTETRELPFSVTKKDGDTKLGTYTAGCGDGYGKTLTITFTVTGTEATVSATSIANTETLSSITPTAESIQPIQVKGTGQKTTSNWDFQPNYCTTTADLVLTITEDGWGKLEITGDAFYDHMNCLGGIGWEKWLVEGTANVANETVSFMSCSRGDTASNEFNAQGTISYSGGVLSGEVTCIGKIGKDPTQAGRVVTIIKAP